MRFFFLGQDEESREILLVGLNPFFQNSQAKLFSRLLVGNGCNVFQVFGLDPACGQCRIITFPDFNSFQPVKEIGTLAYGHGVRLNGLNVLHLNTRQCQQVPVDWYVQFAYD